MDYFVTDYGCDPPDSRCAALEDTIMHKGRPVAAGSKILGNFISPLDATVVTKLESAGITILGKTKMEEFNAAGLFADSRFSSGAVSAVAGGLAAFALCNDYTGAIRRRAAEHGLYYIHPTYGSVSRYGLVHAVSSMDQIGVVCKTPEEGYQILEIIAGYDPKDGAMLARSSEDFTLGIGGASGGKDVRLRIGLPTNVFDAALSDDQATGADGQRQKSATAIGLVGQNLESVDFVQCELKYFEVCARVMQILCFAELSANITRYDGVKFGYRADGYGDLQELYKKTRTEAFGMDAKLAAIAGAMALSKENYTRYYDKAMRIRRLIKESLEFDKYDVLMIPATGIRPGVDLALGAIPQLCGLPALAMPFGSIGFTLIAAAGHESVLYSAYKAVGV